MDVAYISALSALVGSVVGGATTGLVAWLTYRAQVRTGRLTHDLSRRQDLFKDFIVSASKLYADALVSNEPKLPELVDIYAMISRMRVLCSPQTVACAEKIMVIIVDAYFAASKTMNELRDMIRTGSAIDPLKEFSEAARDELQALE